jgi:hypothetical protein
MTHRLPVFLQLVLLRAVVAEFNGERIVVRSWPASENRVVIAEFHY